VPITLSARDRRIRLFRDPPYVSLLFSKNRFARLLYRDWRYTACWAQILLHSAALNGGRVEPISLRRIATSACLSIPTVVAVLAHAEATGAIAKHRFEDDRRLLILVPSAAMLAFTESACAQWSASAASMVGRGDPWDQMQQAGRLSLQRVSLDSARCHSRRLPALDVPGYRFHRKENGVRISGIYSGMCPVCVGDVGCFRCSAT
jgi:hypothetical protein